ncbi:MAG: methylmalonyl-CoA mutase [Deltaproteobacteria bacterium]|nr:methylmalonyl-CoA mutase [Deltaproteobacteria bacterium]
MTPPKAPERWLREIYSPSVVKNPERRREFRTASGARLAPVYAEDGATDLPGVYPFTRGIHPSMYRSRFWTMRQYAGFGDAAESNRRYRYLLAQGQTGLSIAFDLPTQMGYDADSARAAGEVGKVGVAVSSLADMQLLFDQIPLDQVSTSMTINATAATLLAFYLVVAKQQQVPFKALRGTIQNDVLKEYMARGTYIYPPRPSMRIVTDIFAFCGKEVPQWNTISISGYHIREAGSTAVQEVAFTLADGLAYVQAAIDAGQQVDDFAPRLAFFFNVHNNLFEEVAKFRAARRLWATLMRQRFGAKDPRSQMLRFHTQTAGCTLTAQQPDNNVVRVALQALAAVLGGTQSLHTNSMDEALALPSERAATLALRTQQVIAHETGVADVADPLGGAYLVEAETDEIAAKALALIERIDAMGGMVAAVEQGFPQRQIEDAAYQTQLAIERKEQIVVGVNGFNTEAEALPELLRPHPETERRQKQRLAEYKAGRSRRELDLGLAALAAAAAGGENLMPKIIGAVCAGATVGEVADTLRRVFGEYREAVHAPEAR